MIACISGPCEWTCLHGLERNSIQVVGPKCRLGQAEVAGNVVWAELSAIPNECGQPVEIIVGHIQLPVARIQFEALTELPVEVVVADITAGRGRV